MKIDLHTHTCYSKDAVTSPEDFVKVAKIKGLDGIGVTDHDTTKSWEKILEAGKKYTLGVILGEEIQVFQDGKKIGEVLGLFLNEEIESGEFPIVKEKIKEQGGILIAAHPFDVLRNPFKRLEEFKHDMDAIEVFNARSVFNRFNEKAKEFAVKNNMAMTGGSDAHCRFEIGNAGTIADISDVADLGSAIKHKKTKVWGKKTNPLIHSVSTMAKTGLIGQM